jgi:purine nucleosidase
MDHSVRNTAMSTSIPVVIDTDIGSDPDDVLALSLALASPELDLRGVTIVSGDVDLRARMAARILGMAGRTDIPVFKGQGPPIGVVQVEVAPELTGLEGRGLLDQPYDGPAATVDRRPAIDWLVQESKQRPFHLVAIGPLTNVALAMELAQDFAGRLLSLTIMGGLLDPGTMPLAWQRDIEERGGAAWPDYNTTSDPAAALQVAQSGIPITWVPLDVTMRAPLRQHLRGRLPPDQPLAAALGRMIDSWHAAWFPVALPDGIDPDPVPPDAVAILHDPLAVAALIPGDWLRFESAPLRGDIEDGVFRLRKQTEGDQGRIANDVDGERFAEFCLTRILRLSEQASH